jgi:hypothetical protein
MTSFGTFAKPGQKLSAQTVKRLQQMSNANTPQGGFNKSPNGFTPPAVRGREFAEDVTKPWSITAMDGSTGEITLAGGDVEIHGNAGTSYYTPATLTVTLSNGINYVYLEIDPHAASPAVTIQKSGSKPNSDNDTYRPLLWRIDYNSAAKIITPVKPYRSQNVEFVGWRK